MKNIFIIILLLNTIGFTQSINKKYFVEEKISGGSNSVGEFNLVEYSIKTYDNKLLYKISNKTDYDIPYSGIEVFDNGNSVLINSFYGTLTFFNNQGVNTKELKLSNVLGFEYERNIRSVVDNNSLLIAFKEDDKDYSFLQKYNSEGVLEKTLTLSITNINGIAFSEKLDQIYISFNKWNNSGEMKNEISLIDGNGNVLKDYNATFEKGYFTGDNRLVAFSNKSLISIDTESLNILFKNRSSNNKLYLDIASEDGAIIVAEAGIPKLRKGKWIYNDLTLLKLNSNGKIIDKKNVDVSFSEFGFKMLNNKIKFVAGKKEISID